MGKMPRERRLLGAVVITGMIVFIWAVLVTLIVLYHLPLNTKARPTQCSAVEYTGEVCRAHLKMLQDCLADRNTSSEIYITASSSEQELQAQQLLTGLNFVDPTPECREAVEPFLCLYVFGLCDSSGELYLPSSGECETLTTETCAREWTMAQTLLSSDQLPQCDALSETSVGCDPGNDVPNFSIESETEVNSTDGGNTSCSDGPGLMCADSFYLNDSGVCLPDCSDFHLYPTTTAETAASVLILIAAVFGILSGILVILLSCVQYKQVFGFPSALVRYQTITMIVFNVVVLMGLADHEVFYCSSQDLTQSLQNPTPFCTFSGVVFTYVYWQLAIWWLCHIAAMFWGLKFPFSAHKFDVTGKTKYLHLTVILLGLTLPWLPVVITFATGGFAVARFPPVICFGKSETGSFYGFILPAAIALATGLTLLFLVFWLIYKESRVVVSERKGKLPEVKVLIIVCYFLGVSILAFFSYTLPFWFGSTNQALTNYILCQAKGIQPDKPCDGSEFNAAVRLQAVHDTIALLITLIPTVNLLYAVNLTNLKQYCVRRVKRSDKAKAYTTHTVDF